MKGNGEEREDYKLDIEYEYDESSEKSKSLKAFQEIQSGKFKKSNKKSKEEKTLSIKQEITGWLIYIGIVICVTYLVITFVGQRTEVSGESMAPTLHSGDNLIVDKLSYRFTDPERYDIIVFPYQYEEGKYYIKRIIGMPGETVLIENGEVYINGELLGETYGAEIMDSAGIAAEEIVLGEDEYFVLGDNRNNSSDSRDPSVGIIYEDDIIGKAFVRIWPLSQIGGI